MIEILKKLDRGLQKLLTAFCSLCLAAMVVLTIYTVVMRYVFKNPPFWGDTVTLFCNIWLVMLALALTVRERNHISLNFINELIPSHIAFFIELFWTIVICVFGIFLAGYGFDMAMGQSGRFWELNYLPKKYPMMIMPIAGVLIFLLALPVIFGDVIRWRKNDWTRTERKGN
jgi:TRAP-type C4-dicarboxylate transport system permease small subunit